MQETGIQALGQEDSPGAGNGNPPQYSCLENSMYRGAWQATVHRVKESQIQLSNSHALCGGWRKKHRHTASSRGRELLPPSAFRLSQ